MSEAPTESRATTAHMARLDRTLKSLQSQVQERETALQQVSFHDVNYSQIAKLRHS